MADDNLTAIFSDSGYTYPGSPESGALLLLSIVREAQAEALAERTKYARLVQGLSEALDNSPLHGAPGDPLKHIDLLCARVQERQVATITNIVHVLRMRHPAQSALHPGEDGDFLAALDELTDPKLAEQLTPLVEASVAYWQALQRGDEHAKVAAALTVWSQSVRGYLTER